jgi:hypothetical protein
MTFLRIVIALLRRLRHCEERSDEASQCGTSALDCFAALAMTGQQAITTESESISSKRL